MKYQVITITNDLSEYPEYEEDTLNYPNLVQYVEDELGSFIVDENDRFWPSSDFFSWVDITEFETNDNR